MSESEVETDGTSGIKIPRFHGRRGEDYGLWRLRLRAACRLKGVWDVFDSSAAPSSTTSTADTSSDADPVSARNIAKREKASGIIISALGDAPLRVVLDADDDPGRMLKLLDARYASNRTVSRIAVQTQLFRMTYTDQNMSTYVDQYTSLFAQLEQMGKDAAILETHKAPMLLASIDTLGPLESTAAALRTKDVAKLTWDYVATTLIDEYNARHTSSLNFESPQRNRSKRKKKPNGGSDSSVHKANWQDDSPSEGSNSDLEVTARALAAALKSFQSDRAGNVNRHHCDFCDKDGHTEDRCFLNPDSPSNRLPPKVQQLFMAQTKKSGRSSTGKDSGKGPGRKSKVEIAGTTIEKTTICPPQNLSSYADSGATVHCFHSASVFVPGSIEACEKRTVILADKTSVVANRCGDVILPFENANIRLKRALYIPNLGYNLVSIGRLADKGIESHFRGKDVELVLAEKEFFIGKGTRDTDTGMYILPEPMTCHEQDKAVALSASNTSNLWPRGRKLHDVFNNVSAKFRKLGGDNIKAKRSIRIGKLHSDGAKEKITLQNSLGGGNGDKSFSRPHTSGLKRMVHCMDEEPDSDNTFENPCNTESESYDLKSSEGVPTPDLDIENSSHWNEHDVDAEKDGKDPIVPPLEESDSKSNVDDDVIKINGDADRKVFPDGRVLKESGLHSRKGGVQVRSDNQAAISWAVSEKCPSGRAKHIDARVHFVRELVKKSLVEVVYVPSEDNDADMLTKPLGRVTLDGIKKRIGLGREVEEEC